MIIVFVALSGPSSTYVAFSGSYGPVLLSGAPRQGDWYCFYARLPLAEVLRNIKAINSCGSSRMVVCVGRSQRVLLPGINEIESFDNVRQGPTGVKGAGGVSRVQYTVEIATDYCIGKGGIKKLW